MSEQLVTIGDHNITLDLHEDDIVTDVVVLARVMRMGDPPGSSGMAVGRSEGVDNILHRGMLSMAQSIMDWECECDDCQDDE